MCICFACTVHMLHISTICVGQTHKGVRTIDRVRVNSWYMVGTDCKDSIQSGG